MSAWFYRFFRRENGVAAIELGLVTPIFLMMFLSVTELGHMIYYSITLEKGMRSGITYLARAAQNGIAPTEDMKTTTRNLTMHGTLDGSGKYLVPGYEQAIDGDMIPADQVVVVTSFNYIDTVSGKTIDVDVIAVDIYVPYVPLMDFITNNIMGTFTPSIHLRHEQAVIGD